MTFLALQLVTLTVVWLRQRFMDFGVNANYSDKKAGKIVLLIPIIPALNIMPITFKFVTVSNG